jgi:hypothetical protein
VRIIVRLDDEDIRKVVAQALQAAGFPVAHSDIRFRDVRTASVVDGGIYVELEHPEPTKLIKLGPYR